ncbi:MFS transporter [Sphingobium chlorophenolicum]|nr:MFS transporter [Sphingobium chlorophenolicum]
MQHESQGAAQSVLRRTEYLASILVATFALAMTGVQPIFVGLLADRIGLSIDSVALLLGAEQFGLVAGATLGFGRLRHYRLTRWVFSAGTLAAIASAATALAGTLPVLMALRFIVGMAVGAAYTVSVFALGRSAKPDRAYGLILFAQTLLWAIYAPILPLLASRLGAAAAILSTSLWFILVAICALGLPQREDRETVGEIRQIAETRPANRPAWFGLAGMFLLQVSIYAQWGFLERVGKDAGMTPETVGWAFGIGLLGGLPGGMLPALIADRFGHRWPIAIGTVTVIAADLLFALAPSPAMHFLLAVFLLNFGWVLALAYYMGFIALFDRTGSATRLISMVQTLGTAFGPVSVALIVSGNNLRPIFLLSSVAAGIGILLIMWVIAQENRMTGKKA